MPRGLEVASAPNGRRVDNVQADWEELRNAAEDHNHRNRQVDDATVTGATMR